MRGSPVRPRKGKNASVPLVPDRVKPHGKGLGTCSYMKASSQSPINPRLVPSSVYRPGLSHKANKKKGKKQRVSKKQRYKSESKRYLSVGDHLEELRWRLIFILITIFGISLISFFFSSYIHSFLIAPYARLTNQKLLLHNVYGSVEVLIKISITLGITLSLPICLSILWRFVTPALNTKTSYIGQFSVAASALLFWSGLALAWLYIFPLTLRFLFQDVLLSGVSPQTTVEKYYSFLFLLHIGCGLAFQLPLLSVILGALRILSITWHKKNWKYVVVATLLFTALITPPDPLSQLLLSALLLCLYALSVFLVWLTVRSDYRA